MRRSGRFGFVNFWFPDGVRAGGGGHGGRVAGGKFRRTLRAPLHGGRQRLRRPSCWCSVFFSSDQQNRLTHFLFTRMENDSKQSCPLES